MAKIIKTKTKNMKTKFFLFLCKANSGRSQMAEAFFNYLSKLNNYKLNNYKAISAGIEPDREIHPLTIKVMKELKIDVSKAKPKLVTEDLMKNAYKIIVLDPRVFRVIPKKYLKKTERWMVGRLAKKPIFEIRKVRDRIKKRIEKLIRKMKI